MRAWYRLNWLQCAGSTARPTSSRPCKGGINGNQDYATAGVESRRRRRGAHLTDRYRAEVHPPRAGRGSGTGYDGRPHRLRWGRALSVQRDHVRRPRHRGHAQAQGRGQGAGETQHPDDGRRHRPLHQCLAAGRADAAVDLGGRDRGQARVHPRLAGGAVQQGDPGRHHRLRRLRRLHLRLCGHGRSVGGQRHRAARRMDRETWRRLRRPRARHADA